MAGTSANDFQNGAPFYLDSNQQDLLLAALASNNQDPNGLFSNIDNRQAMNGGPNFQYSGDGFDPTYFASPQQSTPANAFSTTGIEDTPFLEYADGDNSFDFDDDNNDVMIGALPGGSPGDEGNEKRKSPDDDAEDGDNGGKRRETEDKQAKKPGRKPLTSEPTTKRKAQNRAAQRAFRERKEKHLKDLESKVSDLEKASDAANHENGLLRAQVQRLQMELREYRKRLSLNSTGINRSPPIAGGFSSLLGNNNNTAATSNFQFEFPRFGGLPGAHLVDNGPLAKSANKSSVSSTAGPGRQNSTGRSLSPRSQANASSANSPEKNGSTPSTTGAQRSGSLNGFYGGFDYTNGSSNVARSNTDSSTSQSRVFQFNSGSSTHSDSPSASSTSQVGQNSSCDTSPEPSHNSPNNPADSIAEGYVCHGNSEAPAKTPATDVNGIDFFANQNGGQFDPTLFGDYRDTNSAIVGDGDFTGGFFNEAFPVSDFGSPFHFGDTPAVQKPNPLEEIERAQDGEEEEVVPGEDTTQMLNCHKIWDKLSNRADFKDGTIDIDNLCSELRAKARCSESGVVVGREDVEAALKRLPQDMK